jgi:hypothetical protein
MKNAIKYTIDKKNKYLTDELIELIGLRLFRLSTTSVHMSHMDTFLTFENRVFFYFSENNKSGMLSITFSREPFIGKSSIGVISAWNMIHDRSFMSYDNNGFMISYDRLPRFVVKEIEIWGYKYEDAINDIDIIVHTTLVLVSADDERIWIHVRTCDDRIEIVYSTTFLDFFNRQETMSYNKDLKIELLLTIK